jgi:hypothetical protein
VISNIRRIQTMQAQAYVFLNAEISLLVEALDRAGKRQASEARWHYDRDNEKLGSEHDKKAKAMFKLIAKLQPVTELHGMVRSSS